MPGGMVATYGDHFSYASRLMEVCPLCEKIPFNFDEAFLQVKTNMGVDVQRRANVGVTKQLLNYF